MMNDQLPRESLLETIELMVQTAKTYSLPDLESEIGYIRRYYERLQSVEPDRPTQWAWNPSNLTSI